MNITKLLIELVSGMNVAIDSLVDMVQVVFSFRELPKVGFIHSYHCGKVHLSSQLNYMLEVVFVLKQNEIVFLLQTMSCLLRVEKYHLIVWSASQEHLE
jgi:hypothetical protein